MLDSNSFFFEVDDIDLFTNESNQEESNIQFIDKLFCLSKEEGMAATDDRDLNNLTSFTETEKIFPEEKKNNMTISDELNETSFTVKSNDDDDDETNNESHSKRLVDFSINVIHPPNPSDIFNIKVRKSQTYESSSLGCAMATYIALGVYKNVYEAKENMIHYIKEFNPNKKAVKQYKYLYKNVYRKIYPKLKKIYKDLTKYQQNFVQK